MNTRVIICILFLFNLFHLFSQTDDIGFRRVSPPGGFYFQAIHSFNQDKYGHIWMGGFDGVIRYNSKDITRYVYKPTDPNGLPSNTITSIAIDSKNNIWVSTDKGLCHFNTQTQEFNQIKYTYEDGSAVHPYLYSIDIDKNDTLWIADENYMGYFDTKKQQLIRITKGLDNPPRLLHCDETNRLWLGSVNGSVYLVHSLENKVEKKITGPGSLVRTICTSFNSIWVGYESHGARLYDSEGKLKKHYSYSDNPKYDIKNASIRKICRDTRGQIWIGSYHGLFKSVNNKLIRYDQDTQEGLPHNSIFDIFEDSQGGIWVGTWSGGVTYLHHSDNKFMNFRHSKEPHSLSDNMISSFAQMPNGEFFVGTELYGLNLFNPEQGNFKQIHIDKNIGVVNIKDLEVDKRGGLWIASAFNGVFLKPSNALNFIHFPAGEEDGKHVSSKETYALCATDSGMWIGTNLGGINFYNFKTKKISFTSKTAPFSSLTNLFIRSLSIDSKNNLWSSTSKGLFKIHLSSNEITHFSPQSGQLYKTRSQSFYFAKELSDGKIWIGTQGDGINIYDPTTNNIEFFNANGLLKNKDVYGIIEGENNNIWITSNDGLILYNHQKNSSRRFVITDGIQGNLFNPNAIFKDRNNNLYFGGTNGFSLFEPKTIRTNKRPPNIFIDQLKVNNKFIVPRQTGINSFDSLILSPTETNLHFYFSADNYLLPDKNLFKYRLKNYVDDWVENSISGSANFVNIPAGEYVFEVKACNNDGIWNENPAIIPITIQEFWYKSTLARVFYALIFLVAVTLIILFFRERLSLKKALLVEKIKHDHEENLHEMKIRFFTNISHEFRTPLTLISGPIKNLLQSKNLSDEQQNQLDTVKRNTNRLLQLINQIMDLRKVEKGLARLNITKIELIDFINERILNFSEEARFRKINFSFKHDSKDCSIEADEEKLDKIIYNLLSNAFKYTPKNGSITISLQHNKAESTSIFSNQLSFGKVDKENFVEIAVIDNGPGIDSEDLPKIFDRFEQGKEVKSKANSTGIGLNLCKDFSLIHQGMIIVQSTPGKGTRFCVLLPTSQKAQKIMYESHEKVKNIDSWEIKKEISAPIHSDKEKVNLLVVEDNQDLRDYIVKFLRKYYTVHFAENGIHGLEILSSQNIELVISDVMMPQMDGFEFCQTIKSQIETSHIPVILLTALSSNENTSTGLEKGADAYLSKPFDENVLLAQIKNLLTQRKRLQDNYAKKFMTTQPMDIGSLDNYFLNKINMVIEKNMTNENLSVDMLAVEIGLSRSQLFRKIKQITNQSTSEYINMVKIKKATTLIASQNYTIDEVSFQTGFNSHSYFTKCFKKIHGQTPKEYLNKLKG